MAQSSPTPRQADRARIAGAVDHPDVAAARRTLAERVTNELLVAFGQVDTAASFQAALDERVDGRLREALVAMADEWVAAASDEDLWAVL